MQYSTFKHGKEKLTQVREEFPNAGVIYQDAHLRKIAEA